MLPTDLAASWQRLAMMISDSIAEDRPLEIQASLRAAMSVFESQLLAQNIDDLPAPIAAKMRSYLTESHRLLRLLSTEAIFIATARNPQIVGQRRQAYRERLDLLLQFCQAAIDSLADSSH